MRISEIDLMIGRWLEEDLEGLLEPLGAVTTEDEGGMDGPLWWPRLTGLPAHGY
jgi:hypothetical protein